MKMDRFIKTLGKGAVVGLGTALVGRFVMPYYVSGAEPVGGGPIPQAMQTQTIGLAATGFFATLISEYTTVNERLCRLG